MYIQLNNQVLFYEIHGEQGPTVLLLHGNGETHEIFDELVNALESDYRVVTMDSRGHGQSAMPKELHYQDMAGDVIRLIKELELDHPLLVGYSDGAIVGMLTAMQEPSLLSGLILCGGNMTPKGLTWHAARQMKRDYKKMPTPFLKLMLEEPSITPEDLAKIQVKTLVLAGEHDMIKEKETKRIASCIPQATVQILKDEYHGSYVEHNTKLLPYIRSFTV